MFTELNRMLAQQIIEERRTVASWRVHPRRAERPRPRPRPRPRGYRPMPQRALVEASLLLREHDERSLRR